MPNVIVRFIAKHRAGCHGADDPEGGITLVGVTTDAAILEKHRVWATVLEKVRSGEMPPRDEPRPATSTSTGSPRPSRTFVDEKEFLARVRQAVGQEWAALHCKAIRGHAEVGHAPWEAAIARATRAALCSPNFLFRVEPDVPSAETGPQPLDDHALASRSNPPAAVAC